ncbi:sensor histidine kinase [Dyella sp. 20L07]|uniref:sensor histidine kinase n=1 Tax=Dyella sp. 20L07 TaxID=3384240 RepID=UPI003D2E545E
MIRTWLFLAQRWLRDVPVIDPVDRRNATLVQVLMICTGVLMPVIKLIHVLSASFRESMTALVLAADVFSGVLMMAAAWGCLYLVRLGRFRMAVTVYLGVMLLSGAMAHAWFGLKRLSNDPFPLLILGLSGLVLGRRALWQAYVALMGLFCIGLLSDIIQQLPRGAIVWEPGKQISMALSYLVVAVILDRTITALRESLVESNERGLDLERSNRRLEQEIIERERAHEKLVHAKKMEVAGRLSSGIAHDFSNVLAVIVGYASRRERLADAGTAALVDALAGVELSAHRALLVCRRLLSFGRLEDPALEVFDSGQAVEDLVPMLRQLFGADVQMNVVVGDMAKPVLFDRGQFELMLLSLAANARDAMPDGGSFDVHVVALADASQIEIALTDSGLGMSADVKRHVFDPFYTTKPSGSGTGLGLATVYDMMQSVGGEVRVESSPGQGTCFRLRFPMQSV